MKQIFFIIWLLLGTLTAEEELIVQLSTEQQRVPLYLTQPRFEAFAWDKTYGETLQSILKNDLSITTIAKFIPQDPSIEKTLTGGTFEGGEKEALFAPLNPYFVIRLRMKEKSIEGKIFSLLNKNIKMIAPQPLTGDLKQDRQAVHRLADAIHKIIFGIEGVSSTKILYTIKEGNNWSSDIWECDYDGENTRKITESAGYIVTPTYIIPKAGYRSGGYFYVSYKTGQPKIYYGSLKEKEGRRLTLLKGNQLMPALSPKRDKIAFISDVTGNPDLFLIDFDPETGPKGEPRQIFSAKQATQGSPCFSPDGTQIAFVSNKDGSPRIYKMGVPHPKANIRDLRPVLVSKLARESSAPSWSPDGNYLAYSASIDKVRQICVCDLRTGKETILTSGGGNKENPSWAPNSQAVVFNLIDKESNELYVLNIGTKETFKISKGNGKKRFPCWEPLSLSGRN